MLKAVYSDSTMCLHNYQTLVKNYCVPRLSTAQTFCRRKKEKRMMMKSKWMIKLEEKKTCAI
jgi:hypothetical protein